MNARKNAGKPRLINYPRAGRKGIRRWIPSWRLVCGSFFIFCIVCAAALVGFYMSVKVPQPADFALAQTTTIYYSDGKTKLGSLSDVNRTIVGLDKIPENMQHALVASEDKTFYENSGVSPTAIFRAFINNLLGRPRQGGSTLTQQYAERYYLGNTKSYLGKLHEAVLALKLDASESKEKILENYLNTIYFGRGAYGVEEAAKAYFGVGAKDLSLEQSALLVAVIPAPSAWDPAVSPKKAKQRYERVLRRMSEDKWIDKAAADRAMRNFPNANGVRQIKNMSGTNGYLMETVRREMLRDGGFSDTQIATGGYRIVSTIDKKMQDAAVEAVDSLPKSRPANNKVGLFSMDPRNGEVYALYGGKDYLKEQQNAATQARAQAGSTFKMFALTEALEQGIPLSEKFPAPARMYFPKAKTEIVNSGGADYGMLDLIGMTKYSANTSYIALNDRVGSENTLKRAEKMGLSEKTPGLNGNYGNVLGSASVTAKEMARAYGAVANEGKMAVPHLVREVHAANGSVLYRGTTKTERVLSAQAAQDAVVALKAVLTNPSVAPTVARKIDREIGGKTGTSSGPVSAWFIGFAPQMVTAVNMYQSGPGGEEQKLSGFAGVRTVFGSTFPLDVWTKYTAKAMKGMEKMQFTQSRREKRIQERRRQQEDAVREEKQNKENTGQPGTPAPEPQPAPAPAPAPEEHPEPRPAPQPGEEGNLAG